MLIAVGDEILFIACFFRSAYVVAKWRVSYKMKTVLQTFSLSQKAGFGWFGCFELNGSLRQYSSHSCRFSGKRGEEIWMDDAILLSFQKCFGHSGR